jgi:hypothetical protein
VTVVSLMMSAEPISAGSFHEWSSAAANHSAAN